MANKRQRRRDARNPIRVSTMQNRPTFGQARIDVHGWTPDAVEISQELLEDSVDTTSKLTWEIDVVSNTLGPKYRVTLYCGRAAYNSRRNYNTYDEAVRAARRTGAVRRRK